MTQSETANPRMTVAEWGELDEDLGGELVDGLIEEEELPTAMHEAVAAFLLWMLRGWVAARGGMAFGSELKLALGAGKGRKADACAYLAGRALPARRAGATTRPPSIVVEVLSARPRDVRRDRVYKLAEYSAFGVEHYWIVDPVARTLEVHRLARSGEPALALSAAEGVHALPGCDGLSIDLDALWAECDRLPESEDE